MPEAGAHPAIDPARSAAVAASAGTGKTWLLAARIARLLLQGAPAGGHEKDSRSPALAHGTSPGGHEKDSRSPALAHGASPGGILALTFTRKAAAEMQARVMQRLRALALADSAGAARLLQEIGLAPTPPLLARARELYEELLFTPWPLRATTIHAFCQELVTRFALQTGTSPGFEVCEDEEPLLDAAWQRLQRALQRSSESDASRALAALIAAGYSEHALRELVLGFLRLRNDWRAYAGESAEGLAQLRRDLQARLGVDDADEERSDAGLADLAGLVEPLRELCGYLDAAGGSIDRLAREPLLPLCELHGGARFEAYWDAFFTAAGSARKFKIGEAKKARLGGRAQRCLQVYQEIVEALQRLRERRLRLRTLRHTLAGAELGSAALAAFEQELRERGVLSFAELEWRAYRLLRQSEAASWVQYRLDARIEHLLIDEFQDTSDTQWQLLLPLLAEMAAGGERARSAFVVGDAKQSIYGFRRANPQLLEAAAEHISGPLGGLRGELSHSRRSAPAIIDFVNALFSQPAVAARLPAFPAHGTHREQLWGRVELAPLVAAAPAEAAAPDFRNPLERARTDPENRRAYEEGRLIAARIAALCAEGYPVAAGQGEDARQRGIVYSDIMILLRKRTHQAALERALAEAGIPFVGSARGTLLQTAAGADLVALLRFLASPSSDLSLAQVLRSPLFALEDGDLEALARGVRAAAGPKSWWQVLEGSVEPRWARARRLLGQWLPLARQLPAHDLIDRIVWQSDAAARYEAALPPTQAARVRANLAACAQLALAADSGRYPSLSGFLRHLDQAAAPDEAPPPAAGGAVRILTIHAAKGLEAPAVFLAQAASGVSAAGAGWLVDWPAGAERPSLMLLAGRKDERDGLSLRLLQTQAGRAAAEDLNLLYVACTRARQFLHISGFELERGGDWHALAASALQALGADGGVYARGQAVGPRAAPAAAPAPPQADERLARPLYELPATQAEDEEVVDAHKVRRGIAIHFLLQQLSAQGADAHGLREALDARLGEPSSAAEYADWRSAAQRVLDAPALAAFFDPACLRRAWNEVPLHHAGGTGVIDRLIDDGDTLWLLDYKTETGASDAQLLERYRPQLQGYREGLRRLYPQRKLRAGLLLTAECRWLELHP